MEIYLPQGEKELLWKVMGACLDNNGKIIGTSNKNPFLNTVLYEVKIPSYMRYNLKMELPKCMASI